MPITKTVVEAQPQVVAKIPARCYLKYEEYMDWHLDHRTKPTMPYHEWSINRKRILDHQE